MTRAKVMASQILSEVHHNKKSTHGCTTVARLTKKRSTAGGLEVLLCGKEMMENAEKNALLVVRSLLTRSARLHAVHTLWRLLFLRRRRRRHTAQQI